MLFNPSNFLRLVKSLVVGGGFLKDGINTSDDAGFLKDFVIPVGAGALAAGATVGTDANAQPRISVAATNTGIVTYGFVVPREYDESTDEFTVRFWALSGGATDTPTITVTPRVGNVVAAPTAITAVTTAAVGATATLYEVTFRRAGLVRNSLLTLTFTSAAHGTDALLFYGVHITIRSTLVSYNATAGTGTRGVSLR